MTPERFNRLKAILERRQLDLTVLMDNVHKPHNLSAIVRTCDAVGVHQVHAVTTESTIQAQKDVASGTGKWVSIRTHPDLPTAVSELRRNNMQILSAHLSGDALDFRDIDYTRPTAVLVGSELYGVSQTAQSLTDKHIVIPMLGMTDSLNVSVATALILFEAQRQRTQKNMYAKRQLNEEQYRQTLFEWCHPRLAAFYQQRGLAYPELDETGRVLEQQIHIDARLNRSS